MSLLKVILKFAIIAFLVDYTIGGATEEQMNSAGKLMRDVCFPKFPKVSSAHHYITKAKSCPYNSSTKELNCRPTHPWTFHPPSFSEWVVRFKGFRLGYIIFGHRPVRFDPDFDHVADNIKNGVIPDDKDVKCYINCILEMMQTIKKGKFLYESTLKQVDILMPDHYKEEYYAGLKQCKDAANGIKNHCDAAYVLIKCLYAAIPRFIFP